ncbi:MAG: hypothetical protein WCP74_04580 [Sphingobacteriia bacterium]
MDNAQPTNFNRLRLVITVVISLFTFGWLFWSYSHGGVPSHHILNQKDLPTISNWWSGILLPVLAWILLGQIKKRLEKQTRIDSQYKSKIISVLVRFVIGLVFGVLLSVSFVNDFKPFLDNVLYFFLILSFIIPIFFSEFILGFVISMTYTFGAILPTAFILIMAVIGFVIYRFIRPVMMKLIKKSRNKSTPNPNR